MRKALSGAVACIFVLAAVGLVLLYAGAMPIATKGPPLPGERMLAHIAVAAAIGPEGDRPSPVDASEPHLLEGAKVYAANCAVCHGTNMVEESGGFFDLRTFPAAQRGRFMTSVSNGKNSMPPWKNVLSQQDIGALFAYVVAGQNKGTATAN